MANELTVENLDIAKLVANEDAAQATERVKSALEADPEVSVLVKAAETVEDVYEIIKKYSKATLAQVKVLFDKTVDYFKETKAELSDETLDNVVGGWSFSSWWNKNKADIIGWTIVGVACVVGLAVGAVTGGVGGAAMGLAVGAVAGLIVGSGVATVIDQAENR